MQMIGLLAVRLDKECPVFKPSSLFHLSMLMLFSVVTFYCQHSSAASNSPTYPVHSTQAQKLEALDFKDKQGPLKHLF